MTTDYQDEELGALLASLPQPSPGAELDAAILADAETALATPVAVVPVANAMAANDSADGAVRTLPAKKPLDYLARWRIPLGLAAAVLLTFNLVGGDFFGHKQAQFPVVGEPRDPPVAPSAADMAPPAPPVQAEAMRAEPSVRRAMTAPAPMPAPPKLDASVWLVKIDGLLKAGQAPAAKQEWAAFRQAYPDYPVEKQLQRQLEP